MLTDENKINCIVILNTFYIMLVYFVVCAIVFSVSEYINSDHGAVNLNIALSKNE